MAAPQPQPQHKLFSLASSDFITDALKPIEYMSDVSMVDIKWNPLKQTWTEHLLTSMLGIDKEQYNYPLQWDELLAMLEGTTPVNDALHIPPNLRSVPMDDLKYCIANHYKSIVVDLIEKGNVGENVGALIELKRSWEITSDGYFRPKEYPFIGTILGIIVKILYLLLIITVSVFLYFIVRYYVLYGIQALSYDLKTNCTSISNDTSAGLTLECTPENKKEHVIIDYWRYAIDVIIAFVFGSVLLIAILDHVKSQKRRVGELFSLLVCHRWILALWLTVRYYFVEKIKPVGVYFGQLPFCKWCTKTWKWLCNQIGEKIVRWDQLFR